MDGIELETIIELLSVTLFSLYSVGCFSLWMPFIFSCKCPQWMQLILQFLFIALPQSTITIVPQHAFNFFILFGLFGSLGFLVSYFQYTYF